MSSPHNGAFQRDGLVGLSAAFGSSLRGGDSPNVHPTVLPMFIVTARNTHCRCRASLPDGRGSWEPPPHAQALSAFAPSNLHFNLKSSRIHRYSPYESQRACTKDDKFKARDALPL
uniref:Uncharacterized protein n=1 Tax=Steinernema glaseri TaxID=37863 RepID=A0A1I7Y6F5_9BILA